MKTTASNSSALIFGSVCSGIEAASVAWQPLGWRAAWLAEIDKFASAVLAHHYPSVPNLGDMTKIALSILLNEIPPPDVLCGGTPCQAFSVAGLRESLADARGNLTLKFVEIANAIDHVRAGRGDDECIVFWENVPGVLSTKDNAFGCFLAGLAGEDEPLVPPGQAPKPGQPWKWANAGAVYGPRRSVAWRTLDAQYFGVAQRRRRVFVVASARKGFDPAQVLFEWDGVRRDTAPSREARQTAPTIPARSTAGGGLSTDFDCDGGLIAGTLQTGGKAAGSATQQDAESGLLLPVAYGGNNQSGPIDVATARNACASASGRMDFETETFLVQPVAHVDTMPTMTAGGPAATSHNQTSGQMRDQYVVPVAYATKLHNTASNQSGKFYENYTASLDANSPPPAIVFDTTQITSPQNVSNPQPGDACHPLAAGAHAPAIAFNWNAQPDQMRFDEHCSATLTRSQGSAVAWSLMPQNSGKDFKARQVDVLQPLMAAGPTHGNQGGDIIQTAMQVRRLTPTECERLQGFPDGYTAIPWRGKPADQCPDGPRYKALGNSWAVPNVTWIGRRIQAALRNCLPPTTRGNHPNGN